MSEIEKLKNRLFDLGAKNFKFDSPLDFQTAENPEALLEEIAEQINNALDEIDAGKAEEVVWDEEDDDDVLWKTKAL